MILNPKIVWIGIMIWRSFLLANLKKIAVASTVLAQYAIDRFLTLPAQRIRRSL